MTLEIYEDEYAFKVSKFLFRLDKDGKTVKVKDSSSDLKWIFVPAWDLILAVGEMGKHKPNSTNRKAVVTPDVRSIGYYRAIDVTPAGHNRVRLHLRGNAYEDQDAAQAFWAEHLSSQLAKLMTKEDQ